MAKSNTKTGATVSGSEGAAVAGSGREGAELKTGLTVGWFTV
jgi:hypothetical protein